MATKPKWTPAADRIIIELPAIHEQKIGGDKIVDGIIVPDGAELKKEVGYRVGVVVAVGPDVKVAKPGDRALVNEGLTERIQMASLGIDITLVRECHCVAFQADARMAQKAR